MATPADEQSACHDGIMEYVMPANQIMAYRCKQSSITSSYVELNPQRRKGLHSEPRMRVFAHIWLG